MMHRIVRSIGLVVLLGIATSVALPAQGFFEFDYEVMRLDGDINSDENDYAPVESLDGKRFFMTSYRDAKSIGEADVFQMTRSGQSGPWSRLFNPGPPFNGEGNDGSVALIRRDSMLLFAAEGRPGSFGSTDLYIARYEAGRLLEPQNLGAAINTDDWESQPAVSADEQYLYFVSDRPGGYGEGDIWVASRTGTAADGTPQWGAPVNAGPSVNTSDDERSPTLALDGKTLYFASDGHPGFGGYDIYMATKLNGEWRGPENLGSIINSDEDDLFFYAPRSDQPFYFSTSRDGGVGGLDIFSGTPNVFGRGLFALTVNVIDSNRAPLPGVVTVTDRSTGDTVATVITDLTRLDYDMFLPAFRAYRVTGSVAGRPSRSVDLEAAEPDAAEKIALVFSRFSAEEFDLAKYTIPFFVTGYYRPNTSANLTELFSLRDGELKRATYIENFAAGSKTHDRYKNYAKLIEELFESIRKKTVEDIVPRFTAESGGTGSLEVQVTGYADPQTFVGTYHESEEVTFLDPSGAEQTITKGSRITNLELSGLRAWHSSKELRRMFEQDPGFRALADAGRVRYVIVGGGVAADHTSFETQRRIAVTVEAKP